MAIQLVSRFRGAHVPHLQIRVHDRVVLSYLLRSSPTVIGRSDQADIALPSDAVSRVHCVVEQRGGDWWVVDRSRHGTRLEGRAIREAPLAPGATFEVGEYRVRLTDHPVDGDGGGTATRLVRSAEHEELLDLGEVCAVRRVELRVLSGPAAGVVHPCPSARTLVGGRGAHVELDVSLPMDALVIRVVRGRALVESGSRPVFLDGQRVREPTPILEGEVLRVGNQELEVCSRIFVDAPDHLPGFGELVGSSPAMQQLFHMLEHIARREDLVLLLGESGTGKELAARAIHDAGVRHDQPFIALNCAAIPENLVESELFGHEAGAFTGAAARRDGAFQRADGGTLFLDEIGEMAVGIQAKLLRALESGEVQRVGAAAPEFPDVRIIAATHQDLSRRSEAGSFRRDLFYRLVVLTVRIPPLRDHVEDLAEIARALLARQHPNAVITSEAVRALRAYPWPGNVRELRNVLTRAVVLHGPRIDAAGLSFQPWSFQGSDESPASIAETEERERLRDVLERHGGNRARAARELGLARTSLIYRMKRLGLT